jgi:hypothetical protein
MSNLGEAYVRAVPLTQVVWDAVIYLNTALLTGALAPWLSSLKIKPLVFWAQHPWRVFWAVLVVPVVIGLLFGPRFLGIYGRQASVFDHGMAALGARLFDLFVMLPAVAVVVLSAVQGLYITWHTSHARAVLVVAPLVMLDLVRAVLPRVAGEPEIYRPPFLAISWIVGTCMATYLTRRLAAKGEAISTT